MPTVEKQRANKTATVLSDRCCICRWALNHAVDDKTKVSFQLREQSCSCKGCVPESNARNYTIDPWTF
jgi:hypothetical protein